MSLCLNGRWEYGDDTGKLGYCMVPGVSLPPDKSGKIWLRRRVRLPQSSFTRLLLILKGARFCPEILINGDLVSHKEGGMCITRHLFFHPACIPGAEIQLEIRLSALDDVPAWDASRIPESDLWRTNLSSCLWDDVLLYPVTDAALVRIMPRADDEGVRVLMELDAVCAVPVVLKIMDDMTHQEVAASCLEISPGITETNFPVALKPWSPDFPYLYRIIVELRSSDTVSRYEVPFGRSVYSTSGRTLLLNGQPIRLRGPSIAWHRFCRDPEGQTLAFDTEWLEINILRRAKNMGANYIRIHLGPPREVLLDLCDRLGLCVQLEWIFFHGMEASSESLVHQWRELFTLASRHPCVSILHLWNETESDSLKKAYSALNRLENEKPSCVISHLETVHLHKYWWSLFENLNLSYDSANDFSLPAIADEFGGNYLDGAMNVGAYPEAALAFERFLGRDHTIQERDELQCLSHGRVGEYWRRIGIAGCSNFCALSSPADGNNLFLGPLKNGIPKHVWAACSVLYAPRAASLKIWDRAFTLCQTIQVEVCLMNDTDEPAELHWRTAVIAADGERTMGPIRLDTVPAYGRVSRSAEMKLPSLGNTARLQALLWESPWPVSEWPVRLHQVNPPSCLQGKSFSMLSEDEEWRFFALSFGMVEQPFETANVLLGNHQTLLRINEDAALRSAIARRISEGAGLLLVQLGPQWLGEGYFSDRSEICLDGDTKLIHTQSRRYRLPFDRIVRFDAQAEAESCCHPPYGASHFPHLQRGALQLCNGYRGGLAVPAASMILEPNDYQSMYQEWIQHGADEKLLLAPDCTAYHLEGFYAFSTQPSEETALALRQRVRFLVSDAPSLAQRMDPESEMDVIPVGEMLRNASKSSNGSALEPLAVCGRGLNRIAAGFFRPQSDGGVVVLSQLLTKGRLVPGFGIPGLYGVRYDPEMAQFASSLLSRCIER